jgi:UDP-N-acetylmuramyl pentapeptide phosphotransferase/UDP-N-acetylglucosamine-1-phosphate transferase
VISAIVLCHGILGLTDDRYSVPAAARLIYSLSLTAAILATDRSLTLRDLDLSFGLDITVGSQLAYLLTLFFVVGFIYAVNMIDGMNGVLGSYALLVTLFFATRLFTGNEIFFVTTAIALAVFLAFNLTGQVFAGDGGAYVVGAGGAMLLLHLYDQAHDTGAMPFDMIMVVVCIPVLDALRVSLMRLKAGRSAFAADRNHLHHRLMRRFGPHRALFIFVMLAGTPMAMAAMWPSLTWLALLLGVVGYAIVIGLVTAPAATTSNESRSTADQVSCGVSSPLSLGRSCSGAAPGEPPGTN